MSTRQKKAILLENQTVLDRVEGLTQRRIANALGISPQHLGEQLRTHRDVFNPTSLTRIIKTFRDPLDTYEKQLQEYRASETEGAWQRRLRREKKQTEEAIKVFSNLLLEQITKHAVEKKDLFDYASMMKFMRKMPNAIWIIKHPEALAEALPGLLSEDSCLKQLLIAVSADISTDTRAVLEKLTYGRHGNFRDMLNVQLVTSEAEFVSEIIGGITEEGLKTFIKTGNRFYSLEHSELQCFIGNVSDVQDMPPVWKILASPEARAIEHLIREDTDDEFKLSPALMVFLRQQQARFEENPQTIAKEGADVVWPYLNKVLANNGAESGLNSALVDRLKDELNWLCLRDL